MGIIYSYISKLLRAVDFMLHLYISITMTLINVLYEDDKYLTMMN